MKVKSKFLTGLFLLAFAFVSVIFGQQLVAHAQVFNTISGTFTDRSGNPVANASFNLSSTANGSISFTTDSNGHYSVNVVPDVLTLQPSGTFSSNGVPFQVDLSAGTGAINASSGNVTQDLQLDTVSLNVKFVDQSNAPISNATVSVTATNAGSTTLLVGHPEFNTFAPSGWHTGSPGSTDANGEISTTVVRGIVYNVCVVSPADNINVCTTVTPTNNSSSVTLTAPIVNTISGTFTDRSGNPVANVSFTLNSTANGSTSFTTDNNGHYSVNVVPDVLSIHAYSGFNHNGIPFQIDLSDGVGTIDASNGNVTQDLQLDTVSLNVKFVDEDNTPISNSQVSVTATNSGSTTLLVEHPEFTFAPSSWHTGSLDSTDVNGLTQTTVLRGLRYNVCVVDPATNANVCTYFIPTSNSSTVVLTAPVLNTISGTFTDRSGNPVGNVQFTLDSPANGSISFTTDSNGHYSVNVVPDVLSIHAYSSFSHAGVPFQVDLSAGIGTIDASTGDVTQDLQLDTVALDVNFVDGNNAPIPDAQISVTATNAGNTTLLVGHPEFTFAPSSWHTGLPGSTDNNGAISTTILRGIIYSVCAVDPVSSVQHCVSYIPTQNENSVTISQGAPLAAPANLTAPSPTQTPQLTWGAVTNATSYNIYRNSTLIGTSATNSYTDNTATSGTYTYYVTAVRYSSGESGPSNTINVIVDTTAPVVVNVSQAWNEAKQRTDVTLIFSEPVSGLPQGWYGSGTSYIKAYYNTKTTTVSFSDSVGNPGSVTFTPIGNPNSTTPPDDGLNPTVMNVQQVWNEAEQRTEITLIFSEAVFNLPQGWYGSGTSYTKAFYNTNPATVTFVDVQGNPGSATVTPIGAQ